MQDPNPPIPVPRGINPLRYCVLMSLWHEHQYESPFTIITATPTHLSRFIPNECFQAAER